SLSQWTGLGSHWIGSWKTWSSFLSEAETIQAKGRSISRPPAHMTRVSTAQPSRRRAGRLKRPVAAAPPARCVRRRSAMRAALSRVVEDAAPLERPQHEREQEDGDEQEPGERRGVTQLVELEARFVD